MDAIAMDQGDQQMEYNVPLGHPDYEDTKTMDTNYELVNKTMLYPHKKNYLCNKRGVEKIRI